MPHTPSVSVYLVGFQLFITQNFRPCAAEQENFVLFGKLLIKRMIAQMTEQCADTRRGSQPRRREYFLSALFRWFRQYWRGFQLRKFTQEVVAAYADNHKLGLALQQRGQARQGLCGGIAEMPPLMMSQPVSFAIAQDEIRQDSRHSRRVNESPKASTVLPAAIFVCFLPDLTPQAASSKTLV